MATVCWRKSLYSVSLEHVKVEDSKAYRRRSRRSCCLKGGLEVGDARGSCV